MRCSEDMTAAVEEHDVSDSSTIAVVLWTVRDGKLAQLRQAADSLVVDRALNG